jgi:hypothetical protein
MTASARTECAEELTARIRRANVVYAHAYAPLALLIIGASFFPYYRPDKQSSTTYGNLWQEVLLTGREVDVFALFALLFTVGMIALGALGKLSVPGLIAVLTGAIIIGCTLLQSPGYVSPPALTVFGIIDIALAFVVAAVALSHSIHLFVLELGFQRRVG